MRCLSNQKKHMFGSPLDDQVSFFVAGARNSALCTLPKVSKTWEFCSSFKNDSRRGMFEEELQRWMSRGRRSKETSLSEIFGSQSADFLRQVAFWSIKWNCIRKTGVIFNATKSCCRFLLFSFVRAGGLSVLET